MLTPCTAAAAAADAAAAAAARRLLLPVALGACVRPSGRGRSSDWWCAKKQMGRLQVGPSSHRHVMYLQDSERGQDSVLSAQGFWSEPYTWTCQRTGGNKAPLILGALAWLVEPAVGM